MDSRLQTLWCRWFPRQAPASLVGEQWLAGEGETLELVDPDRETPLLTIWAWRPWRW